MHYLTIDIGASSGRHILGTIVDGKMIKEEIYRFKNQLIYRNDHLCWDLEILFTEIKKGLKRCEQLDKRPDYIGIDTWGVDFVLLDANNQVIGDSVSYRDTRTEGMDSLVAQMISHKELYHRTGIQKQLFNTLYQLIAIKSTHPEQLERATSFLMLPDYFAFLLTGQMFNEYTNATTTQLVNLKTFDWDRELMKQLGLNAEMFREIKPAGSRIGRLSKKVIDEIGFDCEVILPASHDTASAFMAVSSESLNYVTISSGTWSLMGTEVVTPITSEASMVHNFSNSGGYEKRFLYLKNIIGLWMIQEFSREIEAQYSFSELCKMAERETIKSIVDCNDHLFFSPKSMREAVRDYCKSTDQAIPETVSEVAAVIYNSLADSYAKVLEQMKTLTGKKFDSVQIIGGGSKAEYVNQRTADLTGLRVVSGPTEATAIGNLICQMIASNELQSLEDAKKLIQNSFQIKVYMPRGIKND